MTFRLYDLISINRYVYARNNPYTYVDPTGMDGGPQTARGIQQDQERTMAMASTAPIIVSFMADMTPGVGDVKGFVEAETFGDYAAATFFLIPLTDILKAGKLLKQIDNVADATKNVDTPRFVYRNGPDTPKNLTPRTKDTNGLSANTHPMPGKNQVIDTLKLDKLCAICDNPKTGHVSIKPKDESQIQDWINARDNSPENHPLTQELDNAIIGVETLKKRGK